MGFLAFLIYIGGVAALDNRDDVGFWRMALWPYYVTKRAVSVFHEQHDINAKRPTHPEKGR